MLKGTSYRQPFGPPMLPPGIITTRFRDTRSRILPATRISRPHSFDSAQTPRIGA
jgi:hypothetical protein